MRRPPVPEQPSAEKAAPEVSAGRWRETAYVPRRVMSKDEILAGLETALGSLPAPPQAGAWAVLRAAWAPFLQQALEQAGGDGIDAHLARILEPAASAPAAQARLLSELIAHARRLEACGEPKDFGREAHALCVQVGAGLEAPAPISLARLERDFEGRVDLSAALGVLFAPTDELSLVGAKTQQALDALRGQLRALPGVQPQGMLGNFARLKHELRLVSAELAARAKPASAGP